MTVDQRISNCLSRQNQMRQQMSEMEQQLAKPTAVPLHSGIRKAAIGLSIAACLAIVLWVSPWRAHHSSPWDELGFPVPTLTEYRAASPTSAEIDDAIAHEQYREALDKINMALQSSADELTELEQMSMLDDEALLYEKELAVGHHYQLMWLRIYALVRMDHHKEAIHELEYFVTLQGEHRREATRLLSQLTSEPD